MSDSLIFFNKEGYPHNFSYDDNNECWNGKIIFDENSDQTFKTQSIHIFEEVSPIDFALNCDFINLEYYNYSGITFTKKSSFDNEIITDIKKVNDSSNFYSKWIYGIDFNKKFPIGSIIYFSGISHSDFDESKFFSVLSNKKNAILILTDTNNESFDFTFSSGTTNSLNVISINDYNRDLSGSTTFFQNLYTNKKFSIINSTYNDKIVSIKQSGITNSYLNEIKLNGTENQIFTLKLELYTERPKVFQNSITITTGTTTIIEVGKYATNLEPDTIYTVSGSTLQKKEITFEDIYGNKLLSGFTFIVDSVIDDAYLGLKKITFKQYYKQSNDYTYYKYDKIYYDNRWNTIEFNGILNINTGDKIYLSGYTQSSTGGTYLMNNREFDITNVIYNSNTNSTILFTPNYVIDESNNYYRITKKLTNKQKTKIEVTSSGDVTDFGNLTLSNTICYTTSNYLTFSTIYSSGSTLDILPNTIDSFIQKYKPTLYDYGINIYRNNRNNYDYLSVESLYGTNTNYFSVSGYTNSVKISDDFSFSNSGTTKKYTIITNEILSGETISRADTTELYKDEVSYSVVFYLSTDTNKFGFRITLNGNEYYIDFSGNTQTTIDYFIDYYGDILYKNGYSVNSGYSVAYTGYTLDITTNIDIWQLDIMVNILSTYEIIENQRNRAILLSGNEILSNYVNLFNLNLATGMILKITGSTYSENNKEYNIINLTENKMTLSYQGVFYNENNIDIIGRTRYFIRKPRGEYEKDIYLRAYWETPYDDYLDESIFFYDVTGNQLTPYNNIENLRYIGQTPLIDTSTNNVVYLNKYPNKDINKISDPKVQQTIFDELIFKLEQLDSSESYNWIPEPLEIFIGYNSKEEGVNTRTLKIERIEKKENNNDYFSLSGYTNSGSSLSIHNFTLNSNVISYNAPADFSFISYGFKKDQIINIKFTDQNELNQKIDYNNLDYKILDVYRHKILIDTGYTYQNGIYDTGYTYASGFTYFNSTGTTFLFKIEVQPKDILYCPIYGETEIEDIRYKVNLNNLGIRSEDDVYKILYQSDINDDAIDFTLFNRKRKEMLTTYREIYDYIGSYKSLINIINYFGYNDLQLYEYYKNIDKSSPLYQKLSRVLIPDIFDNTVEGWNEIDFISGKYQDQNIWKKTNLFNLAYRITDEDGNNVLIYTLDEVQYKLTLMKKWLRKNIIPISANLLDITGVSDTTNTLYQEYDESNQTKKSVVQRSSTVVNFNYTATLNFGNDYLITVNFYTLSGNTGTTIDYNETPISFSAKIKTFYLSGHTILTPTDTLVPVQYFKINKNDLKPFSFNINKYVDPYIYIETTTYDNDGNGLGYVNNKLFYYDEPRNYWLVNNNFDLTKMIYWQNENFITNEKKQWLESNIDKRSNIIPPIETIVNVNTLNKKYLSQIKPNNS